MEKTTGPLFFQRIYLPVEMKTTMVFRIYCMHDSVVFMETNWVTSDNIWRIVQKKTTTTNRNDICIRIFFYFVIGFNVFVMSCVRTHSMKESSCIQQCKERKRIRMFTKCHTCFSFTVYASSILLKTLNTLEILFYYFPGSCSNMNEQIYLPCNNTNIESHRGDFCRELFACYAHLTVFYRIYTQIRSIYTKFSYLQRMRIWQIPEVDFGGSSWLIRSSPGIYLVIIIICLDSPRISSKTACEIFYCN